MVSGARTTTFIQFASTAAQYSKAFVIPDSYTAIVKSVVFENTTAAAARGQFVLGSGAGGYTQSVWDLSIPAASAQERSFGVVAGPGDYLLCYAAAAGVHIWVSGSLMPTPPYFPPKVGNSLVQDLLDLGLPETQPS